MKKNILAALFFGGMACAMGASAATDIVSGEAITDAECALLGEQVTINLSNNVSAAYTCDAITNTITVGACHAAGSRNPLTVTCASSGVDPDITWNDDSCTSTTDTFEIADFRGYTATSQGGKVAPSALGGNCTATTIGALVDG